MIAYFTCTFCMMTFDESGQSSVKQVCERCFNEKCQNLPAGAHEEFNGDGHSYVAHLKNEAISERNKSIACAVETQRQNLLNFMSKTEKKYHDNWKPPQDDGDAEHDDIVQNAFNYESEF